MLGSGTKIDRCGVCGGNGAGCTIVKSTYTGNPPIQGKRNDREAVENYLLSCPKETFFSHNVAKQSNSVGPGSSGLIGKVWRAKGPSVPAFLSGFCSIYEATGSLCTSPGWNTSPSQVTSQHFVRLFTTQFVGSHLYTWVERGTVRVKCFH